MVAETAVWPITFRINTFATLKGSQFYFDYLLFNREMQMVILISDRRTTNKALVGTLRVHGSRHSYNLPNGQK